MSARSASSASARGAQFELQRPRKIEEPAHQRAQPIDLGRNISGQFGRKRLSIAQPVAQHLGGALDDAQGIANLVRQAGGELAERRQAFGSPRVGLHPLELAIGLREFLGQVLVAQRLPPVLHGEAIHDHRRQKEKQDADDQFGDRARRQIVRLQRRI